MFWKLTMKKNFSLSLLLSQFHFTWIQYCRYIFLYIEKNLKGRMNERESEEHLKTSYYVVFLNIFGYIAMKFSHIFL